MKAKKSKICFPQ